MIVGGGKGWIPTILFKNLTGGKNQTNNYSQGLPWLTGI
jgi:hypothetical protein